MDAEKIDLDPDPHAQVRTALMAALETRAVEERHYRRLLMGITPVIVLGTLAFVLFLAMQFAAWAGLFAPQRIGMVMLIGLDGLYLMLSLSVFAGYGKSGAPSL